MLTEYGRTSGFCIDPIEKKPLYHFLPGTPVLSFGTIGCNLSCQWCQNWDISRAREDEVLRDEATPDEVAEAAIRHGCPSVALTYNDPIVFLEYAADVARACRRHGVRTVAVTSGYVSPAARRDLFADVDAVNVDLKGFREELYHEWCGGHLEPVLDTLRWLVHHTDVWVEVTTLVIPGLNDSDEELDALSAWVASDLGRDVPVHFTAFHPAHRVLDRLPTPLATLRRARAIAQRNGLRYVYVGNVADPAGSTTWCAGCGAKAIVRDGYRIVADEVDSEGRCTACGSTLPGLFAGPAGGWGSRRAPVRLHEREEA